MARARWQRATRDNWSLNSLHAAGGSGPSLHVVGGVAAPGLSRPPADTGHLSNLSHVLRDAVEKASTAASDETRILRRSAAVALVLAAAQEPSPVSASAGVPAPPETGSGTSAGRPTSGGAAGGGPTSTVDADHAVVAVVVVAGRRALASEGGPRARSLPSSALPKADGTYCPQ